MVDTHTATKNGNWGDATVWNTGTVPEDGDSVALGVRTVDFVSSDGTAGIDQSAWVTGLAGLSIDSGGILRFPSLANTTYYLKMGNNISITSAGFHTGTVQVGTSATNPIPRSSTCTLDFNGTGAISSYNNNAFYGWYPELEGKPSWTKLTANSNAGTNTITIADDICLKPAGGDLIVIGHNQAVATMSETAKGAYAVASYNDATKVVTLTGNLETNRVIGDYVGLISRQIKWVSSMAATRTGAFVNNQIIRCQGVEWVNTRFELMGAELIGCGANCLAGYGDNLGGKRYCVINGRAGTYDILLANGKVYDSLLVNCGECSRYSNIQHFSNSVFQNCSSFGFAGDNYTVYAFNCTFRAVKYLGSCMMKLYNCKFDNIEQWSLVTRQGTPSESFQHDQVKGAYKCWCTGGTGVVQSTTQYDSKDTLKLTCTSSTETNMVFRDYFFEIKSGYNFTVKVMCQKDFAGANVAGLEILNLGTEPEVSTRYTALASDVKTDDVSNWEELTASYTPTGGNEIVRVRVWAKAASGNVYFYTRNLEELQQTEDGVSAGKLLVLLAL